MKNKSLKKINYHNAIIPESVSQYAKQPLYIIISLWCQQQKKWVNRNDIAQAFSMPERRASFQLSYILSRPNYIHFRSRLQTQPGMRHPCNEIWVERVIIESMKNKTKSSYLPDTKSRRTIMGSYRSRVGNGMSGSKDVWQTLVMMRSAKAEGGDE
ncbi:CaiF/GrlA family transcriptional regulator [Citrobacter freundii]|uniref:CaiF/GrlA family transcriptional regulator n=1 Tax=Citrobacter arsenatis TaxID=2546350 RepID=A0A4P6WG76_9ENTR|nr:CaiF/GrlA family transcriptional regulator [Citrobacter arsenatis]POT25424.1 CaiF/GrlA family transcriptional regulator [Citrobacter freundii]QBM22039.1 CaiF/GrlA family transcriptional regulator [Citrobacter arsenatis]